jgi:hypothetical protein
VNRKNLIESVHYFTDFKDLAEAFPDPNALQISEEKEQELIKLNEVR